MVRAVVVSLCVGMMILPSASADTPSTIVYEGQLKDVSGDLLHGKYDVLFSICDRAVDGQVLWQEQRSEESGRSLLVDSGWYLVELGLVVPIPDSVIKKRGRWLSIRVGTEPEIFPRRAMIPGAYAYRASDRIESERAAAGRYGCAWKDRGSPECRGYGISEWSVMSAASYSIIPRQTTIATMALGFVRSITRNSGLGGEIYLATGKEWRVGPRLRYRRWLTDELAVDVSSGATWMLERSAGRQGKIGYAGAISLNILDKGAICLEYDIFPMRGSYPPKDQRIMYIGFTAGSKAGMIMILLSAVLALSYAGG